MEQRRSHKRYVQRIVRNGEVYNYLRAPRKARVRLSNNLDHAISAAARIVKGEVDPALLASLSGLLARSRQRAADKGWKNDLDIGFLTKLYVAAGGCCAVTNLPFDLAEYNGGGRFSRPFAPSIDRIDAVSGYTQDNVRLVCRIVNFAANRWGMDAVLTMAVALAKWTNREQSCKTDL